MAFVAIKMGRRQGARSGAYLNGYVTDEQRGRRPIFIATLRAVASWLFFRVARSLRIDSRYARCSRLEKQPTNRRRKPCYLWDRTLVLGAALLTAGTAFGQIGETPQQCIAKYGAVVEKLPREWRKFESAPYHLEIHFYKGKADAVQYLNWVGGPKAFTKDQIENLLKQNSPVHWEIVDDSAESTMFVVKGFTAMHMKLDHVLIVATDAYMERGLAAKVAAETGNPQP
jgi:hypothetical protein